MAADTFCSMCSTQSGKPCLQYTNNSGKVLIYYLLQMITGLSNLQKLLMIRVCTVPLQVLQLLPNIKEIHFFAKIFSNFASAGDYYFEPD